MDGMVLRREIRSLNQDGPEPVECVYFCTQKFNADEHVHDYREIALQSKRH